MRKSQKIGAAVVSLLLIVAAGRVGFSFLGFLSGSAKKTPPAAAARGSRTTGLSPAASSEKANDAISTFTLIGHTETGRKKWEVQGETADLLGEVVQLSPVKARSFGEVQVDLTARRGRFRKSTQDVILQKEVVVTTSDGARLTTNSLKWFAQRGMATTLDPVKVTRPGIEVTGLGAVAFPKLKRVRLERKIAVHLQGKEGKTLITCQGPMEVDYARRKARFWRDVVVRDAKGFTRSDRLDLTLAPKTNRVQEAHFWGHVEIHQPNQVAYAHRASYWVNAAMGMVPGTASRTLLTGHTKLVMLSGELKEHEE